MSKCVFMYGRLQPCHLGHGKVFEQALSLKDESTDVKLFLSSSQDCIKNPLPRDLRQYYIGEFFPDIKSTIQDIEVKNLFEIMKELNDNYSDIIFVGGSDRAGGFQKILDKYNGALYNFNSIQTIQAGVDRGGCVYSSTHMRESVQNDDFPSFKICLPGENESLKYEMFCAAQTYMRK